MSQPDLQQRLLREPAIDHDRVVSQSTHAHAFCGTRARRLDGIPLAIGRPGWAGYTFHRRGNRDRTVAILTKQVSPLPDYERA